MVQISLIISVYKNLPALSLIFKSIAAQKCKIPFEVIIAEDNNSPEMKTLLNQARIQYSFPIHHVWQDDKGFRKCKILNAAIRDSKSPYLIFMDGDCLLHPSFIDSHYKFRQLNTVLYGRRVMLSEKFSHKLLHTGNLGLLHWPNLIRYRSKRLDCALHLPWTTPKLKTGFWGHNWSAHKDDLERVRGFDESYMMAGIGEDTDIEWRMGLKGIRFLKIKNHAIQYHLWHKEHYHNTHHVESLLASKKQAYQLRLDDNLLLGNL